LPDRIDYITDLVDLNHIGLGADLTDYLVEEGVKILSPGLVTGKAALNLYPRGIENASRMLSVSCGLVSRGYSDDEILKILRENFPRVIRQIWGS
jgi:membrane dipeptidase